MYVDDIKLAGKKQNINPTWKILKKDVDLGEPTSFLDHVLFRLHSKNDRLARILWIITDVCSNQGYLPGLWKNNKKQKPRGNLMPKRYLHGPITWKVMQEIRGKILRTGE